MPARFLARSLAHLGELLVAQVRGWLATARQSTRRAWAGRPSAARSGAILLTLTLASGGAASLLAQSGTSARLPSAIDWRAAGALLQRDGRPGDAVLVAPAWLERAREVVPSGLPVLSPARLGDERLPGVRRVWLLAARAEELARRRLEQDLARRAHAADLQQLGALEVTRFDLGAPLLPLAALAERAPLARVLQRDAGGVPRRCLGLAAAPGQSASLAFPATPLGRSLVGHAALLPGAGEGPVRVAFLVDGAEVGALELAGGGWRPFDLDTSRHAFGSHLVTLVASTEGPDARVVCVEALALQ